MRKLIRKLLGIKDFNDVSEYDIKNSINEVLGQMLNDAEMSAHLGGYRQRFDHVIQTHINKVTDDAISSQVNNYVKGEKFIDDIVTRIKNKQL